MHTVTPSKTPQCQKPYTWGEKRMHKVRPLGKSGVVRITDRNIRNRVPFEARVLSLLRQFENVLSTRSRRKYSLFVPPKSAQCMHQSVPVQAPESTTAFSVRIRKIYKFCEKVHGNHIAKFHFFPCYRLPRPSQNAIGVYRVTFSQWKLYIRENGQF